MRQGTAGWRCRKRTRCGEGLCRPSECTNNPTSPAESIVGPLVFEVGAIIPRFWFHATLSLNFQGNDGFRLGTSETGGRRDFRDQQDKLKAKSQELTATYV